MKCKPRLVVIVGPTGVGKTRMAISLASEWNAEIISADSMQVYRMMDIGTAKPSLQERSVIRHHLIDIVNPDESFNASMFAKKAGEVANALYGDAKHIFVVGGTGLYIKAMFGGLLAAPGADQKIRDFYRQKLKNDGKSVLYDELKARDALSAARIGANDVVRIIRALEVLELSGGSIVEKQNMHGFSETPYECLKIGLKMERNDLYEIIEQRADAMIRKGLIQEVQDLLERGYHENLKPMQSLGYRHIVTYIRGACTLDEALRLLKRDTRHYAKRQMTWFGADKDVEWISSRDIDTARKRIESFLTCQAAKGD